MKNKSNALRFSILGLSLIALFSCTKTPVPCYTVDKGKTVKTNEEVKFDAACTTDGTSFLWEFGDGTSGSGSEVKHKYSVANTYSIKLTVANKAKTATLIQTLIVN